MVLKLGNETQLYNKLTARLLKRPSALLEELFGENTFGFEPVVSVMRKEARGLSVLRGLLCYRSFVG